MKIAILETGAPPAQLEPEFGSYPQMFVRLLEAAGAAPVAEVFDVQAGALPNDASAYDGVLITGSAAGVYEELPWIAPMMDWLRSSKGRTKLVGVCFGHQAMAQAFGGKVVKSPKGWGIGLQTYDVTEPEPWMEGPLNISLPVSHQDQVVELPPGARAIGGNPFSPNGLLTWDDGTAISMQPHPEFAPAYASALIERRLETVLDEAQGLAAIESLKAPNDNLRVGGWIRRFIES